MSNFTDFSASTLEQFNLMASTELLVTDIDPDNVWNTYLDSFPPGTNEIFRVRREHDCSCCRNFVRNLGVLVAFVNGRRTTVWDGYADLPHPFNVVAEKLSKLVHAAKITGVYRTKMGSYGAEITTEFVDGHTRTWDHFHATVPAKFVTADAAAKVGDINATARTLRRGLEELTPESIETVLSLIDSNSLYRGAEFRNQVKAFSSLHLLYHSLAGDEREALIWSNLNSAAARIRNTAIGTLLVDLSAGIDLDLAVAGFEAKVAPTNYKRTTSLITPVMVKQAMETIKSLDLEHALERRLARLSDVSVNNVLWVDNETQAKMRGGIENILLGAAKKMAPHPDKVREMSIDEFMAIVAPEASSLELYVKNEHLNNFVTLTAPVHADVPRLFKWDNDFAWSYDGNVTDSIKERVKKAGGNVSAPLRVSLAWFNHDDLDIHVYEPSGRHIYFGNKYSGYGKLDVDMNAGVPSSRTPVENVAWQDPQDGVYTVEVHQFCKRETSDAGFVIEIESNGAVQQYSYKKALRNRDSIVVGTITVRNGAIVALDLHKDMVGGGISQEKWGVATEQFVKVQTLMLSPNHWDDNETGNKHWIFALEGCRTDTPARGIYNEFLRHELEKHRKVFEVLGDRTKCEPVADQISGLGFSSTRKDTVTVRVTGANTGGIFNLTF